MKNYRVIFIDDERDVIEKIIEAVNDLLSFEQGYSIEYKILTDRVTIENMNNIAADIVLFDCALGGAALDFEGKDKTLFGVQLMKHFREKNKRTKIIFYSGQFSLTGSRCYDFTHVEMLQLINDLHIYKMGPKNVEYLTTSIREAILDLDAVIMSLEDLKEEYNSAGDFLIENDLYSIDKVIDELKNGSELGEKFRKSVIEMVLTYMMKFGGDED
jgi:TATA-box binding protein (TBP) (component of TFIID and TFIIIB)